MSQPVKLSDELVLDARLAAESFERSIGGQIEFWAQLGRAVDTLLHYEPTSEVPGTLVRIDADGKRTIGRFVNRKFEPSA